MNPQKCCSVRLWLVCCFLFKCGIRFALLYWYSLRNWVEFNILYITWLFEVSEHYKIYCTMVQHTTMLRNLVSTGLWHWLSIPTSWSFLTLAVQHFMLTPLLSPIGQHVQIRHLLKTYLSKLHDSLHSKTWEMEWLMELGR